MVKIKVKKEMTLAGLIQWGWDNGEEQRIFRGSKNGAVCFNDDSWVTIETAVEPDETFTFEVEQKVDEDTKLPTLIELFVCEYGQIMHMYHNESINDAIGDVDENARAMSKAFYILNDDLSMTLIWREGEFVE